jgi:hypothetical protein
MSSMVESGKMLQYFSVTNEEECEDDFDGLSSLAKHECH